MNTLSESDVRSIERNEEIAKSLGIPTDKEQMTRLFFMAKDSSPGLYRKQIGNRKYAVLQTGTTRYALFLYNKRQQEPIIGSGAYRTAKYALDLTTGEVCVVTVAKKIKSTWEKLRESSEAAAKRQMSISSRCVVPIYAIHSDPTKKKVYQISSYCKKGTLENAFMASDEKILVKWIQQIAEALAKLRKQKTAHGDLHLRNILIDKDGRARLNDFGGGRRHYKSDLRHLNDCVERMIAARGGTPGKTLAKAKRIIEKAKSAAKLSQELKKLK